MAEEAMKARPALIAERRRSKVRIARIDRRATRQRHVCESWAAVILQRTKQCIGIDLIAWAIQIAAAIVAAEIVSIRRDGAGVVEDVFARGARIENCISSFNCSRSELIRYIVETTAGDCRISTDSAIRNL